MKHFSNITVVLFFVFGLSACTNFDNSIEQASARESATISPLGNKISADLLKNLKRELSTAMKNGGPVHAISFCNLKALPLTDSIAKASGLNAEIKRISLKYRNPKNAPDEAELMALDYFSQSIEKGLALPPDYVQSITKNSSVYYSYYKPLTMRPACLLCHGTPDVVSNEVASLIHAKYPDDKAMGYKEGDFRGLIRIRFKKSEMD